MKQASRERHRVKVGMTRDEVQNLLGNPDEAVSNKANSLLVLEYRYGSTQGRSVSRSQGAVPYPEDRESSGEGFGPSGPIWGTSDVGPVVIFLGFLLLIAGLDRSWGPETPKGASFRILIDPATGKVDRITPVRAYFR